MISAFDFETFVVVDAADDIEDHGVIEEVWAGEAEAVISVGLGEMGIMLVIVGMLHILFKYSIEHLFYFITMITDFRVKVTYTYYILISKLWIIWKEKIFLNY